MKIISPLPASGTPRPSALAVDAPKKGDQAMGLHVSDANLVNAQAKATTGMAHLDTALTTLVTVAEVGRGNAVDGAAMARRVNRAAATLHALEPQDALDGMLNSLLVGVHAAALAAMSDAARGADEYPSRARCAGAADRLVSAFVKLADLRERRRGCGTVQRVTVEHVTVAAGGQAVIGAVSGGGGGGLTGNRSDQPHAQA